MLTNFVSLYFVIVISSALTGFLWFITHLIQDYFTGTGAIVWLPQCQWSNLELYGQTLPVTNTQKTCAYFLGYTLAGVDGDYGGFRVNTGSHKLQLYEPPVPHPSHIPMEPHVIPRQWVRYHQKATITLHIHSGTPDHSHIPDSEISEDEDVHIPRVSRHFFAYLFTSYLCFKILSLVSIIIHNQVNCMWTVCHSLNEFLSPEMLSHYVICSRNKYIGVSWAIILGTHDITYMVW